MTTLESWTDWERDVVETIARGAGRAVACIGMMENRRRSLDWVRDAFFESMTDYLRENGVPNRVAADMCGMSHRTFLRQVQGLRDRRGEVGSTLWLQIFRFLKEQGRTREQIFHQFRRQATDVLASILRDMVEGELLVLSGTQYLVNQHATGWDIERLKDLVFSDRSMGRTTDIDELVTLSGLPQNVVEANVQEVERSTELRAPSAKSQHWWAAIQQIAVHHADVMLATFTSSGIATTQLVQIRFAPEERQLVEQLRTEFRRVRSEFWTKGTDMKIGEQTVPQEMLTWTFCELTDFLDESTAAKLE